MYWKYFEFTYFVCIAYKITFLWNCSNSFFEAHFQKSKAQVHLKIKVAIRL